MSDDIDYAARVQRGIALLDEKWPTWATDVDLDRLDIENTHNCMTAQYAQRLNTPDGDWVDGKRALGLDAEAYSAHGFNAETSSAKGYDALNRLWKAEIVRRRKAAWAEASER
jgi:hypothetical protein